MVYCVYDSLIKYLKTNEKNGIKKETKKECKQTTMKRGKKKQISNKTGSQ